MNMIARRSIVILALVPLLPFVSGCGESSADAAPAPGSLVVRRGDLVQQFVMTGEIRSRNAQLISVPPLPEWNTTIQWLAEDGSLVKAGERVVELDNSTFAGTLDQRRLAVTQSQNQLAQFDAQAATTLAEAEFDYEKRRIDLQKAKVAAAVPKEIISLREWEDAQLALTRAETEFRKAEDTLRSEQTGRLADRRNHELELAAAIRELETAERAIQALALVAPADGIFILREHPWEGRRFQVGDRAFVGLPLAEIPDPSSLIVEANLWDVDDGKVAVNEPVEVIVDAWPDHVWKGRVTSIAQVAQEAERQSLRRAFRTQIDFDEIDPDRMRPGYSVRVRVPRTVARDVLLASRAAVIRDGDTARLRLENGGTREVTLGPCNAQDCVVVDGAREGERLRRAEDTDAAS